MKLEMLQAEILAPSDGADEMVRDVVFYTGAAIDRIDFWSGKRWWIKFSMEPEDVRLDRLNNGAPVLKDHIESVDNQLGVSIKGWLENGLAKARLRFSAREEFAGIWQDIKAGIIKNVSMGVAVETVEKLTQKQVASLMPDLSIPPGEQVFLALGWEPRHIAVVPQNADPSAQFLSAQRDGAGEFMYRIVPVNPRLDYLHAIQGSRETNSAFAGDGHGQAGPDLGSMIATARLREAIAKNESDSGGNV